MAIRPDGRYRGQVVEVDRSSRSDAEEVREMHRPVITVPVIIVTTAITAFASVLGTWLATRHEPATSVRGLTKDEFEESMRARDERLGRRLDSIETDTSYLKVTLRLVQDRLPPSK